MRILVCSAQAISGTGYSIPDWSKVPEGVEIEFYPGSRKPDAIIGMSISVMGQTLGAARQFPTVPLYCYNWDCYEWVWANPRKGEYDYQQYGELLRRATEVWVPSECTGRRTTQWWGFDNWSVILSSCPYWDYDNVRDDGYALCTLREIPDPWCSKFEECCTSMGIRFLRTNHELSYEGYQDAVAGCRFLVNHYYEASTGGLTLLEGYYLGKPSLCSDSEWNGSRDYLGQRATYFDAGDMEGFKIALRKMYDSPPSVYVPTAREWVKKEYSDERMINDMIRRIEATAN